MVEFSSVDLVWKIHLDGIGLHRRSRRQQDVEALEQFAEAVKQLLARVLRGGEVERGDLHPGLHIPLQILAELFDPRKPRELASDHPGAAPGFMGPAPAGGGEAIPPAARPGTRKWR